MSLIVDIDAHFEPGPEWLDKHPDLAKRLPQLDGGALAVKVICGDLVASIPEQRRPSMAELSPPGLLTLFAQEKAEEKGRRAEFEGKNQMEVANTRARLKWMDSQRIDIQRHIMTGNNGNLPGGIGNTATTPGARSVPVAAGNIR